MMKDSMSKVVSVEDLIKEYDLGVIGTGTLSRDLNRWWARVHYNSDLNKSIVKRIITKILMIAHSTFVGILSMMCFSVWRKGDR